MFSVYGKAGRIFRGSMDELRKIGPNSALARTHSVNPIGRDAQDQNPFPLAEHPAPTPPDVLHRSAVAAYEETRKPEHARHPLIRVDAIMSTAVITLPDSFTVEQAWAVLAKQGIGQAPVVGSDGVLVGLLSRGDLMHADRLPGTGNNTAAWRALLAQPVVDLMWTPVPCVVPDTEIRRVARVLLDTGLPGLPVVNDPGQVIGFVSRSDILRAVVADPPLDLWT
jgi:CBS domain-containing protein